MSRQLVFFDEKKNAKEQQRKEFSEFERARILNGAFENEEEYSRFLTWCCCLCFSPCKYFRKFKNFCTRWCSNADKILSALDKIRSDQILSQDKSVKAVISEVDGNEKEVGFKNVTEFAAYLADLKDSSKVALLDEVARFQFFGTLPAIRNNLINYDIPKSNGDFNTAKWKFENHGTNVLFEVDTFSALLIYLRGFRLFLDEAQFSVALVVDARVDA